MWGAFQQFAPFPATTIAAPLPLSGYSTSLYQTQTTGSIQSSELPVPAAGRELPRDTTPLPTLPEPQQPETEKSVEQTTTNINTKKKHDNDVLVEEPNEVQEPANSLEIIPEKSKDKDLEPQKSSPQLQTEKIDQLPFIRNSSEAQAAIAPELIASSNTDLTLIHAQNHNPPETINHDIIEAPSRPGFLTLNDDELSDDDDSIASSVVSEVKSPAVAIIPQTPTLTSQHTSIPSPIAAPPQPQKTGIPEAAISPTVVYHVIDDHRKIDGLLAADSSDGTSQSDDDESSHVVKHMQLIKGRPSQNMVHQEIHSEADDFTEDASHTSDHVSIPELEARDDSQNQSPARVESIKSDRTLTPDSINDDHNDDHSTGASKIDLAHNTAMNGNDDNGHLDLESDIDSSEVENNSTEA